MKVVRGDLLDLAEAGRFDAIVHGCNCVHAMGAGIALQIRRRWPEVFAADAATPRGPSKLGTVGLCPVLGSDGRTRFTVVNAYTQVVPGVRGRQTDYGALRSAMRRVAELFPKARIGYPRIGAGLGGGDWGVISAILDEELSGLDHVLVELV